MSRAAAIVAIILLAETAQAQKMTPIGLWRTPDQGGLVAVSTCDGGFCARIVGGGAGGESRDIDNRNTEMRARPLFGLMLFEKLTGGPPRWKGSIYNPTNGATYAATVTLAASNALTVRGCIVWPLCSSQTWNRAGPSQ